MTEDQMWPVAAFCYTETEPTDYSGDATVVLVHRCPEGCGFSVGLRYPRGRLFWLSRRPFTQAQVESILAHYRGLPLETS